MGQVILGIVLIAWGVLNIFWGIDSRIPKPNKGYHFVFVQDGYEIKRVVLRNAIYNNDKTSEVNILVMEKNNPEEKN